MHTTTRQTLTLTVLAFLVFTGCSNQKTSTVPEPTNSSSSTSTADASSDATAQATRGKYRPADEHSPAQNVPKPVEPETLNIESEEGLQNFIWYWTDSVNYGIQTGDFSIAEGLISPDYKIEHEMYIWINEIYNRGGWVVGGRREAILGENLMVSLGEGRYTWAGNLNIENAQAYLDEPGPIKDNSSTVDSPIYFEAKFENGKWVMVAVKDIPTE